MRFTIRSTLAVALSALVYASSGMAADTAAKPDFAVPPVLEMARQSGGLEVFKSFPAVAGMRGWVVKDKTSNQYTVVYTTADGENLIAGMILDRSGRNLTGEYAKEFLPVADHSAAFKAFSQGGDATGVTVGAPAAKAEITVLFDANCGYCKLIHKLVTPAIEAGELRVHYVPVAILGADSGPKGAGLLAAKDAKLDLDSITAGGNAESSNDKALLAKVQANTAMLKKYGFNGTPVVMYKATTNNEDTLMVSPGLPNMSHLFTGLGISGQIEKLKQDASLAKYLN